MFGFIPALKVNDSLTFDAFDTRRDGKQVNLDIAHVVTTEDDGEELTTYFGIQGRSDHLDRLIAKRRAAGDKSADANFQREVDTNAVENNMPLQAVS